MWAIPTRVSLSRNLSHKPDAFGARDPNRSGDSSELAQFQRTGLGHG
jgi:hypothetical protein